jgi:rRNA maturation endonuclease Nob1
MTGEWKYSESCNCWVCSICGSAALNDYAGRSTASNFCPTCGNPMIITMDTVEEVKEDG